MHECNNNFAFFSINTTISNIHYFFFSASIYKCIIIKLDSVSVIFHFNIPVSLYDFEYK